MQLSEAQLLAVSHNTGPALVVAGPGSGKTTVITHRIHTLITQYRVNPSDILVITFTKAAAIQMKERFLKLSGDNGTAVAFGTFHAIYFTILKHSCHYSSDCIIPPDKQMAIIREITAQYGLETDDENELISLILSEISQIKNGRLALDEFNSKVCPENTFRKIYRAYDKKLKQSRLIDFDDMLLDCYLLLKERKDIRNAWQEKYKYILIDEFQDINQVQFDVIELIAKKYRNIFAVGDDDQSIYGFRGAKPEIMRYFEEVYTDALHIELSENYRSCSNIVMSAKSVIDKNVNRFAKEIRAMQRDCGVVEITEVQKLEDEYSFVIGKIKELHENGIDYTDMAVLYRINSVGGGLLGKMLMEEIPAVWRFREQLLYEHWIAKDLIAYIQAACGDMTRSNILQIVNKPMRYITRSFLTEPVSFEKLKECYSSNDEMIKRIGGLQFDLTMIRKMTTFAAINYIRKAVGYDEYIKTFARNHHVKQETLFEVAEEITEQAKKHMNLSDWLDYIDKYLHEADEAKKQGGQQGNGVHMQTIHGAKGLEFRVVFILDLNEGMIPYDKAVLGDEIEEERRMLYVAMTRAKESLYMVFTQERYNKKMTASRFLKELDSQSCSIQSLCAENVPPIR